MQFQGPQLVPDATEEERRAAETLGHLELRMDVNCVALNSPAEGGPGQGCEADGSADVGTAAEPPSSRHQEGSAQPLGHTQADDTMDAEPLAMDTGTVAGLQADALPRCWVGHDGKTVLVSVYRALAARVAELVATQPGRHMWIVRYAFLDHLESIVHHSTHSRSLSQLSCAHRHPPRRARAQTGHSGRVRPRPHRQPGRCPSAPAGKGSQSTACADHPDSLLWAPHCSCRFSKCRGAVRESQAWLAPTIAHVPLRVMSRCYLHKCLQICKEYNSS